MEAGEFVEENEEDGLERRRKICLSLRLKVKRASGSKKVPSALCSSFLPNVELEEHAVKVKVSKFSQSMSVLPYSC